MPLPIGYSIDMSLAMSFASILVMVFCHLVYHQICHWLFLWYVTSYCIDCAISHAICNAINFVNNLKIVFTIFTISSFLAMMPLTLNINMALQFVNFIVTQWNCFGNVLIISLPMDIFSLEHCLGHLTGKKYILNIVSKILCEVGVILRRASITR